MMRVCTAQRPVSSGVEPCSTNKELGFAAGLFIFPPIDSAEDAGCIDDTGCRKQPKGDQNKFHDLPSSRLQYSFVLCQVAIRFVWVPLAGCGAPLSQRPFAECQ